MKTKAEIIVMWVYLSSELKLINEEELPPVPELINLVEVEPILELATEKVAEPTSVDEESKSSNIWYAIAAILFIIDGVL